LPDVTDIVTAGVVVTFTIISMRVIYGYWPWQQRPALTMKQEVETVFRDQPPPFQPFSEADMKPEAEVAVKPEAEVADEAKPKD